jgi:hypothetical protein
LSVSDVSEVCFICVFRTHVAIVFIWMLHIFHAYMACVLFGCCVWLQWFTGVFHVCFSSVSEAYFKCFNCLQTYVATVVFGCFKSRSGVASLLLPPSAASSLSEAAGHPYERGMSDGRDGHRTRELRASDASEGALYGWTLPPERDGHWAKRDGHWAKGAAYVAVGSRAQAHGDVGATGVLSYCVGAVDTILFRFMEGAWRVCRTGAVFKMRAEHLGRLAVYAVRVSD